MRWPDRSVRCAATRGAMRKVEWPRWDEQRVGVTVGGVSAASGCGKMGSGCRLLIAPWANGSQRLAQRVLGAVEVILLLQVQPRLRICAEKTGQPQGRVGADTALSPHDFMNTRGVTPSAPASALEDKPIGFMNSSSRISPG